MLIVSGLVPVLISIPLPAWYEEPLPPVGVAIHCKAPEASDSKTLPPEEYAVWVAISLGSLIEYGVAPECIGPNILTACGVLTFSQYNLSVPGFTPSPFISNVSVSVNLSVEKDKLAEAPKTPPVSWYCIWVTAPAGLAAPPAGVLQVPSYDKNCPAFPPTVATDIVPELVTGEFPTSNAEGIDNPTDVTVPALLEKGKLPTVTCLVLLASAESDISIKSPAIGVALVGYVYIIAIISFFF